MPVAIREIYGLQVFDCDRLHATLSPAACSDNYINQKCLACAGCPTGAELSPGHIGRASNKEPGSLALAGCHWHTCVRCGEQVSRLLIGEICVSCRNRVLEVFRGHNAKGGFPWLAAQRLHTACALLHGPATLMRTFYRPRAPSHPLPGAPYLTRIDTTGYWLSTVVTGEAELHAYLSRRLPGAEVVDLDIGPSLAELHTKELASATAS
jgi:hypothetical protein